MKFVAHLSSAAAVLGCALATSAAVRAEDAKLLDLCDYKPAFTEDFADFRVAPRTLGPATWTAHTPWNGDFGDAKFMDPGPTGPFVVKDGELQITAQKGIDGRWRSGLIAAADATGKGAGVRYGYFEARMRMPPGPGTWPAFWLASLKPAKDTRPGVEIDVIEYYGHSDAAYSSALHVWYKGPDKAKSRHVTNHTAVDKGALTAGFHDFGVRVLPETITFYFDRKPVWTQPTPPELQDPLYPLVNLALGSGFPIDQTPNPSVLSVKYVHLFDYDPDGRTGRCPG